VNALLPAGPDRPEGVALISGRGRIVYIPKIVPVDASLAVELPPDHDPHTGMAAPKGIQMVPAQWVLPKNHEEIYNAIVGAMSGGLSITSEAPLTTVMELLNRAKTNETIAHFINFDRENGIGPFAVTLRKQFPGATKSVTCFSPEADGPVDLNFKESGGSVTFTVPAMRTYAMIVVAT
jgi:hypothetical protein